MPPKTSPSFVGLIFWKKKKKKTTKIRHWFHSSPIGATDGGGCLAVSSFNLFYIFISPSPHQRGVVSLRATDADDLLISNTVFMNIIRRSLNDDLAKRIAVFKWSSGGGGVVIHPTACSFNLAIKNKRIQRRCVVVILMNHRVIFSHSFLVVFAVVDNESKVATAMMMLLSITNKITSRECQSPQRMCGRVWVASWRTFYSQVWIIAASRRSTAIKQKTFVICQVVFFFYPQYICG